MDATFQRLPEHEALVAKILGEISLKSRIRVYLDTYNPSSCGHADAWHQTIVLTERCSELKRKDGSYNWFVVQKLGHEIGHIISGHGLGDGVAGTTPAWQQDDADEFSGWVLKRFGASLDEARNSIAPEPSPFSYPIPPEPSSLAAVERGWRNEAPGGGISFPP